MSREQLPQPPRGRARAALAAYLRLLAACLEEEAEIIENDPERSEEVLRKFRDGVLTLSLDDVPLEALVDSMGPTTATPAHTAAAVAPMMPAGSAASPRPSPASKRRR